MLSIVEHDYGTPERDQRKARHPDHRRPRGHRARRHLGDARRGALRRADSEALRHGTTGGVRLLPHVPGADRRHEGLARLLHHAGRAGHGRAHPEQAARRHPPRRDGAVHLGSPARLPHLSRQRTLRAAGHGRRRRLARSALRLRGRESSGRQEGRVEPVFHVRCQQVHRLLALRARLRRAARYARAHHPGTRLRIQGGREPERVLHGLRVRLLRRLRAGLPHRHAVREVADREGPGRAQHHHDLRLLRRGLLVPRRDAGRGSGAHGAEPRRPRQSRPFLRQGPVRHRLCDALRSHLEADDPQEDLRSLARGVLGGGDRLCGLRAEAHSSEVRPQLHRRHHLLALHERGNLPRAEAGARGLRQQQRRHLRARLPFAHGLRSQEHASASRRAHRTSIR